MWCERRMQFGFLKSLSVISTFILLALLPYWWYLYTRAIVVCTKLLYNHSHFIIAPQRSIQWLQRSSLTSAEMWPLVWLSTYTVWLYVYKATLNHNITFIINSFNLTERALSVKRALMVIFPHQNEPRVLCCKCWRVSSTPCKCPVLTDKCTLLCVCLFFCWQELHKRLKVEANATKREGKTTMCLLMPFKQEVWQESAYQLTFKGTYDVNGTI